MEWQKARHDVSGECAQKRYVHAYKRKYQKGEIGSGSMVKQKHPIRPFSLKIMINSDIEVRQEDSGLLAKIKLAQNTVI